MTDIIFYEKPGCINNAKQKALLLAASHQLQVRNLLQEPWTAETLRPFFGSKPVAEWFNPSAPRIKSGEIIPDRLDEAAALALMVADPLLIRRPLMRAGDIFEVGFDTEKINAWIGLKPANSPIQDLETCPRSHAAKPCKSPLEEMVP
ncbi:ArsC/Spx/MgsR family protein [Kamptonema formosum]|uniref:ArsC/Spx/MgsR family protein n=1 Tax=Kamptonema formosum TaxID=331992 RepID=UPI000346BD16|nr:ArsC/Spx/MgsR family protein [Oscillatoria sp. PCC 10802]